MTEEKRKKTSQLNFRLPPELSERFGDYCEKKGLSKQQFFENAVRQALGEPIAVPLDVLGVASHNQATVSDTRLKEIEARLQGLEEVKTAIAPLQNQIEELKGANSIQQEAIEPLLSRLEQLERRLQSEETGEQISIEETGIIKNQAQLMADALFTRSQFMNREEGDSITASDGSVWRFEGREPGGNGAKNFRCVSLGKIQGREAA